MELVDELGDTLASLVSSVMFVSDITIALFAISLAIETASALILSDVSSDSFC